MASYAKDINSIVKAINSVLSNIRLPILVVLIFIVIMVMCLNIKNIGEGLNAIAIALLASGILLELLKCVIMQNVDINNLLIFSDAISDLVKYVIFDVLSKIGAFGILFCVIGTLGIVTSNLPLKQLCKK